MRVLGIDVGVRNLAVCVVAVDDCTGARRLEHWEHVDITFLRHRRVSRSKCTLHHSRCLADRVAHFVQEHQHLFDAADVVAIEQQPPAGLVAVEQLLMAAARARARLVSPVAMHRRYGMQRITYEERKERARQHFESATYIGDDVKEALAGRERSHDVYDAHLVASFCVDDARDARALASRHAPGAPGAPGGFDPATDDIDAFLRQFRHHGGGLAHI